MRPRNKREKRVVELFNRKGFCSITSKEEERAKRSSFKNEMWLHGKDNCWCCSCGHKFKIDKDSNNKGVVCPHCGVKANAENTLKRKMNTSTFFTIVDAIEEYTVVKTYSISKFANFGEEVKYDIRDTMVSFINDKGVRTIMSRPRIMNWYQDSYNYYQPMSIKHSSQYIDYMIYTNLVITRRVRPIIKRNGFDGKYHDISAVWLFSIILTNNKLETLAKAKLWSFILKLDESFISEYWNTIKICIRNGYKPKDVKLWKDYIEMMKTDGKDIRNVHYVCPSDLKLEHDKVHIRLEKKRLERQRKEEIKRALEENNTFINTKSCYFGIVIMCGTTKIVVLDSVLQYLEEGKLMHHCVFSNEYYSKKDSLILSAISENGEREATIELSLKNYKVLQCRGAYNKIPSRFDELVKAVERNKKCFAKAKQMAS